MHAGSSVGPARSGTTPVVVAGRRGRAGGGATGRPGPPSVASPAVAGRRGSLTAAAAGVVVGLVAVATLLGTGVLDRAEAGLEGEAALEALEASWTRWRTSDLVVESEWRRTMDATGGTLRSATLTVHRPPDRLIRQFGAVRGVLNGVEVRCGTDPDGGYRCFASSRPAPSLDEVVADELEAWRSYVTGPRPLYELTGDGRGCFDLVQVGPYPDPPYGRAARLCFDPDSGALRYLRRQLDQAVEEQEALSIRTEVTDADLATGEEEGFGPTFDGPGLPGAGLPGDGPLPGELDPTSTTSTTAVPGPDTTEGAAGEGSTLPAAR